MSETRDPGELLAFADACAQRTACAPDSTDRERLIAARDALDEAVAALDAILAHLPAGHDAVPDEVFTSAAGRAVRDHDRARFRRDYLSARRAELNARGNAVRRQLGALADPAFAARTTALADDLVRAMRGTDLPTPPAAPCHSLQPVCFVATADARHPYAAEVDGTKWTLRVNEFPEAPSVYSLLVDGVVVEELMAWPAAWERRD